MEAFVYDYHVKNYFGPDAVNQALAAEMPQIPLCWLMVVDQQNALAYMTK